HRGRSTCRWRWKPRLRDSLAHGYSNEALGGGEKPRTENRKMKGVHMARLLSVNVGRPREIAWRAKIVYTSMWKESLDGASFRDRQPVDLLLAPPERPGNRHLELVRDGRGLRSTWLISER